MTDAFLLVFGIAIMGIALVAMLAYPKLQWMIHRRLAGRWRIFGYLPLVVKPRVAWLVVVHDPTKTR